LHDGGGNASFGECELRDHRGQLNDDAGAARAKRWVGRSLVYLGRPAEGRVFLEEAPGDAASAGSRFLGELLRDLGAARAADGDVDSARTLFAQALASFKDSADDGNVVVTASALAESEFQHGAAAEALRFAEDALAWARDLHHHRQMVAGLLSNTAMYCVALGRYELVRAKLRAAVLLARDLQTDVIVAVAMQHLAAVAAFAARQRSAGGVRQSPTFSDARPWARPRPDEMRRPVSKRECLRYEAPTRTRGAMKGDRPITKHSKSLPKAKPATASATATKTAKPATASATATTAKKKRTSEQLGEGQAPTPAGRFTSCS
jgi:tetratricopeptide (TPR) repeat protein